MSDCSCMKIKTPPYVKMPGYFAIKINENGEMIVMVNDKKASARINENGELEVREK